MAGHKFAVGQIVGFSPGRNELRPAQDKFKVVRLLPEAASVYQYRIKNQADGDLLPKNWTAGCWKILV